MPPYPASYISLYRVRFRGQLVFPSSYALTFLRLSTCNSSLRVILSYHDEQQQYAAPEIFSPTKFVPNLIMDSNTKILNILFELNLKLQFLRDVSEGWSLVGITAPASLDEVCEGGGAIVRYGGPLAHHDLPVETRFESRVPNIASCPFTIIIIRCITINTNTTEQGALVSLSHQRLNLRVHNLRHRGSLVIQARDPELQLGV